MATARSPRVFISYARAEGGECARRIRELLEQARIPVWQDIDGIPGGEDWRRAIEAAICHSDLRYLVLILTGHALEREIIQWECRLARREGKCIKPIRGVPDLKLGDLPQWLRDRGIVDPQEPKSFERLLKDLNGDCQATRVINMAERPRSEFVRRQEPLASLKRLLLDHERGAPISTVATLVGPPGFGKTSLARALCHDEEVNEIFHDGVLWVDLGPAPGDPTSRMLNLIERLDGRRPGFTDLVSARSHLYDRLEQLATLIVIDDVWNPADAEPFLVQGKRCACVITARKKDCAVHDDAVVQVDPMKQQESQELLNAGVPELPQDRVRDVANCLGNWPQLLALANGWLRARVRAKQPADAALHDLQSAYTEQGPAAFDARKPAQRSQAINLALGLSLDLLESAEADRFRELAVFPPGVDVPLAVVKRLWFHTGQITDAASDTLCSRLFGDSLLHSLDLGQGHLRIHAVISDALRHRPGSDHASLHSALLESYTLANWWESPADEPYLWRYLAWHLMRAGRERELKSLLLDYRWLDAKLRVAGLGALLEDFERLPDDPELHLVSLALRLAARYLTRDPGQLAAQLRGRLSVADCPGLQPLFATLSRWARGPALLHRFPGLTAPGGALVCAFTRLMEPVNAIAISADGKQVLSGSPDAKVRLWDPTVGKVVAVLGDQSADESTQIGHRGSVTAVTFAGDGEQKWAFSGSSDRAAILWDLATHRPWKVLGQADGAAGSIGHQAPVTALVSLGIGRRVLTGAEDGSFILWDLDDASPAVRITTPAERVAPLLILANGGNALGVGLSRNLMIWKLSELKSLHQIAESGNALGAFVVLTSPPVAVVATADGCLATGFLMHGSSIAAGDDNQGDVSAFAIFADRRHAVSGHRDGSLLLWDLEAHRVERRIRFRPDPIHALAAVGEGFQVLVASGSGRLDRLDLGAEASTEPPAQHKGRINCVALPAGGSTALTGANDSTLRIWDMASGACRRKLSTGTAPVLAIAAPTHDCPVWLSTAEGLVWRLVESLSEPLEITQWISGKVTALALASTGQWIVLGTNDGGVALWKTRTIDAPVSIGTHRGVVTCIALRDDQQALTGSSDGSLILWDLGDGELLTEFPPYGDPDEDDANDITACAFGPREDTIIVGYANGDLRVRDLDTTETLQFIPGTRNRGRVTGVASIPDADLTLVAAEDAETPLDYGSLGLWNLNTCDCLATLTFEDPPSALALTRDGRTAVVGDAEGKVHFIEVLGPLEARGVTGV